MTRYVQIHMYKNSVEHNYITNMICKRAFEIYLIAVNAIFYKSFSLKQTKIILMKLFTEAFLCTRVIYNHCISLQAKLPEQPKVHDVMLKR